ncbi:hypothetical protein H632_c1457p1, partial [Helicosporidium sp. ATCC 50920]
MGRVVEVSSFETGVPARLHPPSTSCNLPATGGTSRRRGDRGKPGDLSSREAEPLLDAQFRLSSLRREAWLAGGGVDGLAEESRPVPWLFDDFEEEDGFRGATEDGTGDSEGEESPLAEKPSLDEKSSRGSE